MSTEYIGFTLGGYRSEDLGVKRVSQGNRYKEEVVPSRQENKEGRPNADGTYWWKGNLQQRQIPIDIAFDSMTEQQRDLLKRVLNTKNPQQLILDEHPDRTYIGKVADSAQLSTITFLESGERVYKGEGNFTFTCYFPYAKGPLITNANNPSNQVVIDNDGDADIPFKLIVPVSQINTNNEITISLQSGESITFAFPSWNLPQNEQNVIIDFYNQRVIGKESGRLYTGNIKKGLFFTLPLGKSRLNIQGASGVLEYNKYYI